MTEAIGPPEHPPERPSWLCADCGHIWPCEPARKRLSGEMTGTELAINMYGYLELFIKDRMADHVTTGVFARFIAWTKPLPGE